MSAPVYSLEAGRSIHRDGVPFFTLHLSIGRAGWSDGVGPVELDALARRLPDLLNMQTATPGSPEWQLAISERDEAREMLNEARDLIRDLMRWHEDAYGDNAHMLPGNLLERTERLASPGRTIESPTDPVEAPSWRATKDEVEREDFTEYRLHQLEERPDLEPVEHPEDSEPRERMYHCRVCNEPRPSGFDCCASDDLPEPGDIRETGR